MERDDKIIVLGTVEVVGDPPPVPSTRQYCMICGTECWMSNRAYDWWECEEFIPQLLCIACADGLPDKPDEVRAIPGTGITQRQLNFVKKFLHRSKQDKENNNG